MTKDRLRRLISLSMDYGLQRYGGQPFDAAKELEALQTEFEVWEPEKEKQQPDGNYSQYPCGSGAWWEDVNAVIRGDERFHRERNMFERYELLRGVAMDLSSELRWSLSQADELMQRLQVRESQLCRVREALRDLPAREPEEEKLPRPHPPADLKPMVCFHETGKP